MPNSKAQAPSRGPYCQQRVRTTHENGHNHPGSYNANLGQTFFFYPIPSEVFDLAKRVAASLPPDDMREAVHSPRKAKPQHVPLPKRKKTGSYSSNRKGSKGEKNVAVPLRERSHPKQDFKSRGEGSSNRTQTSQRLAEGKRAQAHGWVEGLDTAERGHTQGQQGYTSEGKPWSRQRS